MLTGMKPILDSLLAVALMLAGPLSASAALLTPATETTGVTTLTDVDGYYFYGGSTDNTVLAVAPSYASVALTSSTIDDAAGYSGYTDLTVPKLTSSGTTTIGTGIAYLHSPEVVDQYTGVGSTPAPTTYYDFATITVATAGSFTFGILNANTNSDTNNALYEVELNGGTAIPLNTVHDPDNSSNDFFNVTATGLVQGDTITILAGNDPTFFNPTNGNSYQNVIGLGGVVFSSFQAATTPEPSTYALMLAGLGLLLAVERFNRRSA